MPVYLNGLILGLSLITTLGPQNVFLIRQGALRKHAVLSAVTCFCCDTVLICASMVGLQHVLTSYPILQIWMTWLGVLLLLCYGVKALKQALGKRSSQSIATNRTSAASKL